MKKNIKNKKKNKVNNSMEINFDISNKQQLSGRDIIKLVYINNSLPEGTIIECLEQLYVVKTIENNPMILPVGCESEENAIHKKGLVFLSIFANRLSYFIDSNIELPSLENENLNEVLGLDVIASVKGNPLLIKEKYVSDTITMVAVKDFCHIFKDNSRIKFDKNISYQDFVTIISNKCCLVVEESIIRQQHKYIFLDTEWSCWEKNNPKKNNLGNKELLSIGVVVLDKNFIKKGEFYSIVKPFDNIEISEYCTRITKFKKDDFKTAPFIEDVLRDLIRFLMKHKCYDKKYETPTVPLYTWSNNDKLLLDFYFAKRRNVLGLKLTSALVDIQPEIENLVKHKYNIEKHISLDNMLKICFLNKKNQPKHNALIDASNLAEIYKYTRKSNRFDTYLLKNLKMKEDPALMLKEIEDIRNSITNLIEINKDKIPNYEDFISYPETWSSLCYCEKPSKTTNTSICTPIPNYFVRDMQAKRLGYDLNNALKIIETQDAEGNVIEYLYDIRTLKFTSISSDCNLDKLMKQTKKALFMVRSSFLNYNNDQFVKILKKKSQSNR